MVATMSNLEYVDLEYGVRVGYETKGEGLDGEHDFRIYQFPLQVGEWWPYGGEPAMDPFYLQELIITHLFDLHVSSRLSDEPTSVWFVDMEDQYTIRGWQA